MTDTTPLSSDSEQAILREADAAAALRQFREVPPRRMKIEAHEWTYRALGEGEAVLLLPGGGGTSETVFRYALALAGSFRVVLPEIPPRLRSIETAVQGLRVLLAQEGIPRAHVAGIAWGGGLAQLVVRRFPNLVDDLVLCHSALPDEMLAARARTQAAWIDLVPAVLLRALNRRVMLRALQTASMPIPQIERAFWLAYFAEYYAQRFRKSDLAVRARLSAQYYAQPPFLAKDLQHWKGRVLIIESGMDEVIDEGDRGALKAAYPGAYVQTLEDASHLAPVLMSAALAVSIHKFLLAG